MAHFAQIDDDGYVTRVVVISNDDILDEHGKENEQLGVAVCERLVSPGRWVQTSYSARFRHRYAGIGYSYDETLDAFIAPQPFPSWVFDLEAELDWSPPTPRPEDPTQLWRWDEDLLQWVGTPIPPKPPVEVLGE